MNLLVYIFVTRIKARWQIKKKKKLCCQAMVGGLCTPIGLEAMLAGLFILLVATLSLHSPNSVLFSSACKLFCIALT